MKYVDGFIAAVPTANRAAYIEHSRRVDPLFKEYGALSCVENWGADVPNPTPCEGVEYRPADVSSG